METEGGKEVCVSVRDGKEDNDTKVPVDENESRVLVMVLTENVGGGRAVSLEHGKPYEMEQALREMRSEYVGEGH